MSLRYKLKPLKPYVARTRLREQHLVLTLGRSGSNTFCSMLNQSPEVLNIGEVLGEWTLLGRLQRKSGIFRHDPAGYLDAVLDKTVHYRALLAGRRALQMIGRNDGLPKSFREVRTLGVKEFSVNFSRFRLPDYLRARPNIKVIALMRPNVLDRMLSTEFLKQTNVVAERVGTGHTRRTVRLDATRLEHQLSVISGENNELLTMIDALPPERVHRVDYDTLFRSPEDRGDVMRGAFEFLGVHPVVTHLRMRKIIRDAPSDLIENFDECAAALNGTAFDHWLHPEYIDPIRKIA